MSNEKPWDNVIAWGQGREITRPPLKRCMIVDDSLRTHLSANCHQPTLFTETLGTSLIISYHEQPPSRGLWVGRSKVAATPIMNYHARDQTGKLSSTIMRVLNMFKVNDI